MEATASGIYGLWVEPRRRSSDLLKKLPHFPRRITQFSLILIHPCLDEFALFLMVNVGYRIDKGIGIGIANERVLDVRFGEIRIGQKGFFVPGLI